MSTINTTNTLRTVLQRVPKVWDPQLAGVDAIQMAYLKEPCILVDHEDKARGQATKLDCHLWKNIQKGGMCHRAFSVFLFNDQKQLLLQKRSKTKITFPEVWTNTCCSHPISSIVEEMDEHAGMGVKIAARRKLGHELGFTPNEVPLKCMVWVSRILYKAKSNDQFGEHEVDYCILLRSNHSPRPNPEEVADTKYVDQTQLRSMLVERSIAFSPWFRLISDKMLWKWWDGLDEMEKLCEPNIIHNFIDYFD